MSDRGKAQDKLILPVAIVTMIAFLAALFQALIEREYTALTIIMPLMLLLGGFAFGHGILKSAGGSDDKG